MEVMKTTRRMRIGLASAVMLSAFGASALAGNVQTVPRWQWVDVMRGPSVSNNSEHCGIDVGAEVSEIGRHGNRVLVQYSTPNGRGTECDTGDVFFLPTDEFERMTERYEALRRSQAEEQRIVSELLEKAKGDKK